MTVKRVLAIIALCGWGVLIALTVIFAFIDSRVTNAAFKWLIAADIILPVLIWVLMMIGRRVRNTRNGNDQNR